MKLLLAEDEKELSKALVTLLKMNNYTVDAVFNGEDALDYLTLNEYDGAILDVMMPKKDGFSVLKSAREQGVKTPVLMLTAKSEIDDKVTGLDLGADDYLTKPFAVKELLARVRAMIRRKGEIKEDTLQFNGLYLDRASYELYTEHGKIKLVNKEFQMMELMMSNPKKIFSAESFLDKIWGCEDDAEITTVWVYVSYLRKKLSSIGAKVTVKAARNVGYFLEKTDA